MISNNSEFVSRMGPDDLNGNSNYLASLLNPEIPASIPDDNMTASVEKQVVADYVSTLAQDIAIWYPTQAQPPTVILLGKDAASGRFNPIKKIPFDLNLDQDFLLSRTVSARLEIFSNTVAAGIFAVSGDVKGITYQDMPAFFNPDDGDSIVTSQTLPSYVRSPSFLLPQTSVVDGATFLASPSSLNEYLPTQNSKALFSSTVAPVGGYRKMLLGDRVNTISVSACNNAIATNGWLAAGITLAASSTLVLFDASTCQYEDGTLFIPKNARGVIKVNANASFLPAIAVNVGLQVSVTLAYANPATFVETTTTVVAGANLAYFVAGLYQSTSLEILVDCDKLTTVAGVDTFFIKNILLEAVNYSGGGASATIGTQPGNQNISVEWITLDSVTHTGPGILAIVEAVGAGQQLSISAVHNVQAVPKSALARNVKTSQMNTFNLNDLMTAQYLLSNCDKIGLKMAYNRLEYRNLKNDFMRLSRRGTHRMLAAGIFDGLRGFWRNYLAPILKGIAPFVGGVIAGPTGAAIGTGISTLIPTYSDNQNASGKTMYATGVQNPWEMSDDDLVALLVLICDYNLKRRDYIMSRLVINFSTGKPDDRMYPVMAARLSELVDKSYISSVLLSNTFFMCPADVQEQEQQLLNALRNASPKSLSEDQLVKITGMTRKFISCSLDKFLRSDKVSIIDSTDSGVTYLSRR